MTATMEAGTRQLTDRAVVVSSDSHVGPSFDQLREYCPKRHLEDFDAFVTDTLGFMQAVLGNQLTGVDPNLPPVETRKTRGRNVLAEGGWDAKARLADMDYDGVAAEIIYHGLNAGNHVFPLPFEQQFPIPGAKQYSPEMIGVGRHIYNQWLADFCSEAPHRLIGLAQLPMWDIDASVKEVEWAASVGLRGVNFPRVQPAILAYNDRRWDEFWAACVADDMSLNTHAQGVPASDNDLSGFGFANSPGALAVAALEVMGYGARSALHYLIFGGVFERYPNLKVAFTEQEGLWWSATMNKFDSLCMGLAQSRGLDPRTPLETTGNLTKLPSEYANQSVWIGATCVANFEAVDAIENDYVSRVMWGRDYPHPEGSYQYPTYDGEVSWNRMSLRDSFANLPIDAIAQMAGENAATLYSLDMNKLRDVAEQIDALTLEELTTPSGYEPDPELAFGFYSFRKFGGFS